MIRLSEAQREAIRAHGAQEFPYECCGVLLGDVENRVKIVHEVRPLRNTFQPGAEFEEPASPQTDSSREAQEAVGREQGSRFLSLASKPSGPAKQV